MAVLVRRSYTDQEGGRHHEHVCHAGNLALINGNVDLPVDATLVAHWVAVGSRQDDRALQARGWRKVGRAWLCPEHAHDR